MTLSRTAVLAAIATLDGRVVAAGALPERFAFSTDTRTLEAGDTFVALRGERYDGHAFVDVALERGAGALVVDDERVVPAGVGAFVVADTTRAYLAFGAAARTMLAARVVAVTGSAGKTTTKSLLAQILERTTDATVIATVANENNEIGVAKLFSNAPLDAAYVVVEFGARHFGEIEPLARAARPDVAILTNVGDAHLEIMGSAQRLADTKWGIFATGAHAIVNADDAVSRSRADTLSSGITYFGSDSRVIRLRPGERFVSFVRVQEAEPRDVLSIASADGESERYPTNVAIPGAHNRANVLAACAGALALGLPAAEIARVLPGLALPAGRYERIDVGGIALIYDAYNASMSGTLATLASFAREPSARRIAVLASMAELGDAAPEMHERVGAAAARSNLDALLVGGDFAPQLSRGARAGGFAIERIVPFASNAMAIAWLRANVRDGDLVLLKGSRRYRLEEIVEGLRG